MKKIISVFLALTMLCAIFTVPVAATSDSRGATLTTTSNGSYYYLISPNLITAEGIIVLNSSAEFLNYRTTITNHKVSTVYYNVHMQCVVTYSDDSFITDNFSDSLSFATSQTRTLYKDMSLTSGKTIISINAEFHVYESSNEIWEGYIDQDCILGINI